ncbi:AHH domain-containing protein [uncultured Photobacterium sp.]|uniref:AHH domain-containing protein n=1 Tax=uncultured Photobacterium sp. TaxID=173973 RepID=UPI002609ABE4|nr:AHH domain-containing protein [uncultured Photobacterium sp.]
MSAKKKILEFDGRLSPKYSHELVENCIRNSHLLNFKSHALAGHHLISNNVVSKLSTSRRKQFGNKGWSINNGFNVVLLPALSEIACHYEMPCHEISTYHMEEEIVSDFYSPRTKTYDNLGNGSLALDISKLNPEDMDVVKHKKVKGYHKVVAIKLGLTLKDLNCKTKYKIYVNRLDNFSLRVLDWLSKFKLLLTPNGRIYHKKSNPCGCGKCKPTRVHFKTNSSMGKPVYDSAETKRYIDENRTEKNYYNEQEQYFIYSEKITKKGKTLKRIFRIETKFIPSKGEVKSKYWVSNRLKSVREL